MRKVMRCAAMMVVSLAVVLASFGLRPMEAKALPVLEDWTDVQAVSTALMAYMESAGMTIMVEADNWQTLASTMWETIADAYVSDVGAEAAGAATGAAWLASLAPQIALIGGGIVVGAAAGVGMFKLMDWISDHFLSGVDVGASVPVYASYVGGLPVTGYFGSFPWYNVSSGPPVVTALLSLPVVDQGTVVPDDYIVTLPGGARICLVVVRKSSGVYGYYYCMYNNGVLQPYTSFIDSDVGTISGGVYVAVYDHLKGSSYVLVGYAGDGASRSDYLGGAIRTVNGDPFTWASSGWDWTGVASDYPVVPVSASVSLSPSYHAPTIPTGSAMRIETGASSSATSDETLQYVGDQIINNTFSPTYTIVVDPSQDPANPPSGEDSGILDWIKSIYYRLTQLATGLAESVSEAIQTALLPSEEFIQELPNRVKTTFADRTGFLTYPISVLVDFVGELGKYAEEDFIISWPDVAEPINGYTIMEAGSFNMSAMVRDNEAFQTIHDLWFLVAKGMMIIAFLRLCVRKFNSVVGDRMVD